MKKILTLLLAITCYSCDKTPVLCFSPPEPVLISILDRNGNDLLNPANSSGYKKSDISIYYKDGDRKVVSKSTLDSVPEGNFYFLNTYLGWESNQGRDFSLQLSPTVTDQLYVRSDQLSKDHCGYYGATEFKYNGAAYTRKMITVANRKVYLFEIIKP